MRELEVSTGTRILRTLGALLVVLLALGATFVWAATRGEGDDTRNARTVGASQGPTAGADTQPTRTQKRQVRETRVSPFAQDHALVSGLDSKLLSAVQDAATAAKAEGIGDFWLTSGWRTEEYQESLLNQAIKKHGSRERALQWVKTPDTSEHVRGSAADIGPTKAAYWMSQNADRFGLCRTYANEIWHYELRRGDACPAMKEDARG